MSTPDFQSIMLPLLQFGADEQEHASRDPVTPLARHFGLSEEEQAQLGASGQRVFSNRVAWALTHLRQAGLVQTTRRGHFKITSRGLSVLADHPLRIDMRLLSRYEEFRTFMHRAGTAPGATSSQPANGGTEPAPTEMIIQPAQTRQTPSELLEDAYQAIQQSLAQDLLDSIKGCSPAFFERLVVDLLVRMGYGGSRKDAGEAVGHSHDGGIDGIIKEDKLGLDIIYIQAKRWEATVGSPELHRFAGALAGKHAHKGIFITTSAFSREALDYVKGIGTKIVLIDGKLLAELMIDHDVGVATLSTFQVKRVDSDYFSED